MAGETYRFIEEYRGFYIIQYSMKSYGIEGSGLYLTTIEVAKRIIDTYLKKQTS